MEQFIVLVHKIECGYSQLTTSISLASANKLYELVALFTVPLALLAVWRVLGWKHEPLPKHYSRPVWCIKKLV